MCRHHLNKCVQEELEHTLSNAATRGIASHVTFFKISQTRARAVHTVPIQSMDLSQVKEKLVAIKELLDSGLISQEDFDKEKAFLLGSFTGSANTVPAPVPAPANMPTSNVTPSAPKTVEQCTAVSASSNSKNGSLVVGVDRDVADPALFRLQVQAGFDGTVRRKRLMVLLLDRSGSMCVIYFVL